MRPLALPGALLAVGIQPVRNTLTVRRPASPRDSRFEHPGPLLAACWGPVGSNVVFCAGADCKVRSCVPCPPLPPLPRWCAHRRPSLTLRPPGTPTATRWDLGRHEGTVLGQMDAPVSSLVYSPAHGPSPVTPLARAARALQALTMLRSSLASPLTDLLIASSFAPSLLLLSSPLSPSPPLPRTLLLPAKPLALALTPQRAIVAMAERLVFVFGLRALAAGADGWEEPEQKRESALKGITRAVEGMPDGLGTSPSPCRALPPPPPAA